MNDEHGNPRLDIARARRRAREAFEKARAEAPYIDLESFEWATTSA